jgi:hypothetical protein
MNVHFHNWDYFPNYGNLQVFFEVSQRAAEGDCHAALARDNRNRRVSRAGMLT